MLFRHSCLFLELVVVCFLQSQIGLVRKNKGHNALVLKSWFHTWVKSMFSQSKLTSALGNINLQLAEEKWEGLGIIFPVKTAPKLPVTALTSASLGLFTGTSALIEIEDYFKEKILPIFSLAYLQHKVHNSCLQLAQNSLITHKMFYLHLGTNQRVENYLMHFFLLSHYKCQRFTFLWTLHHQVRLTY